MYLGKLAIVVSDDSLAFGVNMPFRTSIFMLIYILHAV
jgi:hypothetical protein